MPANCEVSRAAQQRSQGKTEPAGRFSTSRRSALRPEARLKKVHVLLKSPLREGSGGWENLSGNFTVDFRIRRYYASPFSHACKLRSVPSCTAAKPRQNRACRKILNEQALCFEARGQTEKGTCTVKVSSPLLCFCVAPLSNLQDEGLGGSQQPAK